MNSQDTYREAIARLWVGEFKDEPGLFVYDSKQQRQAPTYVQLFDVEGGVELWFIAQDVRKRLATVSDRRRDSAIEKYIDWLNAPVVRRDTSRSGFVSTSAGVEASSTYSCSDKCEACYAPISFCRCGRL